MKIPGVLKQLRFVSQSVYAKQYDQFFIFYNN